MIESSPSAPARLFAVIVAAGRGSRFGGPLPKQYAGLKGSAVLRATVLAFLRYRSPVAVLVVIHPDDRALYDQAVAGLALLPPVHGGATRQESVRLGLEAVNASPDDIVMIHDAARPLLDPRIIDRAILALQSGDAALVAIPVRDTIKRGEATQVAATLDRRDLWRAQTPQAFRYGKIMAAHRAATGLDLTDDAAVAETAGMNVELVMGSEDNFKITTADDLDRANRLAGTDYEFRTGQGFDVHQLVEGDHVWINGIRIPHTAKLLGHSDADVGLHALTDAVLGAIGAGDIGSHFPPGDARWRGADSSKFLAHAAGLVTEKGGRITHCDVTIICERPKIGPHRAAMVARIAEILGVEPGRVSVKATTTEELGFTGRREGIAAQAVATVRLPA
jgi:2-C-methyl-D-erythritol 4-phosphate cytidylyltransferase/2-C-methyl-D-erythritol 2,4-cyclodiphosphate synthase